MTETERLVAEGRITRDFLVPEIRCDFQVDEKRKKVWAVLLDLLVEFKRMCERHGLRWFMMYGSLLGTVRHSGFIPWDDDLDIGMPRQDYNKLLQLGKEFKDPYFLQTPYTDKGYWYSYAKLRNQNTTSLSLNFGFQGYVQGITLDIFCLDNWDVQNGKERFEKIKHLILQNAAYMKSSNPHLDAYVGTIDELEPMALKNYAEIQALASSCKGDTEQVSFAVLTLYGYEKNVFQKSDFDTLLLKIFEGLDVYVPIGYDNILKNIYGDYMAYPSIEKRGTWHRDFIDPDVPYKAHYIALTPPPPPRIGNQNMS